MAIDFFLEIIKQRKAKGDEGDEGDEGERGVGLSLQGKERAEREEVCRRERGERRGGGGGSENIS